MTGKPILTPLDKVIGENAKRIRERLSLTQAQMAETMGCEPNMLSMLENGKRAWTVKYIYAACQRYDIAPAEFMGGNSLTPEDRKLLDQMKEWAGLQSTLDEKKKRKP